MDRWTIRRRLTAVAAVVALLCGLAWAGPTIDAYGRASALLGESVLDLPVRPLTWITQTPATVPFAWPDGGEGVLTLPGGRGAHPAFVLMLGADPAPPSDPRVRRLTDGVARIGFATLLVRSQPLIDGRVTPDEVPLLVGAFRALRADPRIRADRVGFIGLSAGGSLEIVAAADPAIARDVWCVFALGPYDDAATLLADIFGGAYRAPDGTEVAWTPDPQARAIAAATLRAALPPGAADAGAASALLAGTDRAHAAALIAQLGPEATATLAALSPRTHLDALRAPLYLVHDRHDAYVPWPESEAIAAAHPPARYLRLDLFEHVDPHPKNAGIVLRDGWRLLRLFASIIAGAR